MVLGKWSGLQGRWSDPHLGLTNVALLLQMIYSPTNPAPLQTFGSGRQQGSWPPVSHSFPKGWAAPIGARRTRACRKWEALLVLLVGLPDRVWRDHGRFPLKKRFHTIQWAAVWFPRELCCWALKPLQHCESMAWPAQTWEKRSKQVLRVSARTVALPLLIFLTICSKMEALNIRAKH